MLSVLSFVLVTVSCVDGFGCIVVVVFLALFGVCVCVFVFLFVGVLHHYVLLFG